MLSRVKDGGLIYYQAFFHSLPQILFNLQYPCKGHLFTDTDLEDYNHDASELLWKRVLEFLRGI